MSDTLAKVSALIAQREVRVSLHGFRELATDDILIDDIVNGIEGAQIVEDYPAAAKGPSVLVLQRDSASRPVHVVWGIAKGTARPAILITAYRPDPRRWSKDFSKRVQK